jgi:hypothetical protein
MLKSKIETEVDHEDKIDRKIAKLTEIIQKYLTGIEDMTEEREQEILQLSVQFVKEDIDESKVNDWLLVTKK